MILGQAKRVKENEPSKSTRYYSKKQEDQIAKTVGGHRNANSGATPFIKGDVTTDQWLLEAKTKINSSQSISIKKDWIQKNKEEALFMGKKYHSIVFNFGPNEENYYIIDEFLFQELLEYLKNKEN